MLLSEMIDSFSFRLTSRSDPTFISSDFTPSGPGVLFFLSLFSMIITSLIVVGEKDKLFQRTKFFVIEGFPEIIRDGLFWRERWFPCIWWFQSFL